MKIINNLPSIKGTFLNPESTLPKEWEILKKEKDIVLVLREPSSCALAFKVWPDAKNNVRLIVYAGGTLGRGDVTPYAEKSVYRDPYGMESLLNSGINITFCLLEDAKSKNMSTIDLANNYTNNMSNYEVIECGVHVEIQKDSLAFGKLICDYMADKKFLKKNTYLLKRIS